MSWHNYKEKATKLANLVEKTYHKIGGSFLFIWVDDVPTYTYSLAATNHFADVPPEKISEPFRNFFHAAVKNHVTNISDINWWSMVGGNVKFIVTEPEELHKPNRLSKEIQRGRDRIIKMVHELSKEGLPFAFFYRIPRTRSAANGQLGINDAFPEEPHGKELLESDGWKLMMKANKTLNPPKIKNLVAASGTQPRARLRSLPAPHQLREAPAAVGGTGGVESSDELRRKYLQPLQAAGIPEDVLLETMQHMMGSSSSILAPS